MTYITAKLFPDGINPIVGNIDQYSITIVNAGNIDVKQGIEHNFTIWLYQKEHIWLALPVYCDCIYTLQIKMIQKMLMIYKIL